MQAKERGRIHGSLSANSQGYTVATATAQMSNTEKQLLH